MTAFSLGFPIPSAHGADRPPEERGVARDGVRLLVSDDLADRGSSFDQLAEELWPGDLLVVNESATLPASLPARGPPGEFVVHASTRYGSGLWLVEPRWSPQRPGPLPLRDGNRIEVGGLPARLVAGYPGMPRLRYLEVEGDLVAAMYRVGRPIRYAYLAHEAPLERYQTVFSRIPGSAEMPSAGGPFTSALVNRLRGAGVRFAPVLLHAGVSSLEMTDIAPGSSPVYPEPFDVPADTVAAIARTRSEGGRVVAVGTTVVRALESAAADGSLRPSRGFTRLYLHGERPARVVDALLTGFHDGGSTHLELLASVAGAASVRRSYRTALATGCLWHEFGDAQLLWARGRRAAAPPTGS